MESWKRILEDLDDPKKKAKSAKCKVAADERVAKVGYSHRCGRGGYRAIVEKFVSESMGLFMIGHVLLLQTFYKFAMSDL